MNLQKTREWAKNRDGVSSFAAITLGMAPYAIQNLYTSLTKQNVHTMLSGSDIEDWIRLYKKHRLVGKAFYREVRKKHYNLIVLQSKIMRLFLRTFLAGTPIRQQRLIRAMEVITEAEVNEYREEVSDAITSLLVTQDERTTDVTKQSLSLEFVFFLKIYVFCWLEYGEHVITIYRKARHGNFDAIEKLLRIDPLILHDKFIREHYTTAPRAIFHRLQIACNNPRKNLMKISHIKSSFCGFISAFFEHVGQEPLTPLQIRELFNTLARDLKRKPVDEDLPDEYDAFRKAVKRYHKFWLPIIHTTFSRRP